MHVHMSMGRDVLITLQRKHIALRIYTLLASTTYLEVAVPPIALYLDSPLVLIPTLRS